MSLPQHIAFIMDGNGRWANRKGKPRWYGHMAGVRALNRVLAYCADRGVKHVTLFCFSTENWSRPEAEVRFLMDILRRYLTRGVPYYGKLTKTRVRFRAIGDLSRLPDDIQNLIRDAEVKSQANKEMSVTFAINYGGQQDIIQATQKLAKKVELGTLKPEEINETLFAEQLETYPHNYPDLIVRTSGEYRISNFLLWQAAYAELYFMDVLWPDISEKDLDLALLSFLKRDRRFGAIQTDEHVSN